MRVEGDVPLEIVLWLEQSHDGRLIRALAAASPRARWWTPVDTRAAVRLRGGSVEIEPQGRWSGLVTGRIRYDAPAADGSRSFEPYAAEIAAPPLSLSSCWFALDADGRVACFDRDQLGAAPKLRCWGPRPAPPSAAWTAGELATAIAGRHADGGSSQRAFSFVADRHALGTALEAPLPVPCDGHWTVYPQNESVLLACTVDAQTSEPIARGLIDWAHDSGVCRGCAPSSMRDRRLGGAYVYQHHGRARAAPYTCVSKPVRSWNLDEAVAALGVSREALQRSVLPLRFEDKPRLQPIEYTECTWSETVPWEGEDGRQHGQQLAPGR